MSNALAPIQQRGQRKNWPLIIFLLAILFVPSALAIAMFIEKANIYSFVIVGACVAFAVWRGCRK